MVLASRRHGAVIDDGIEPNRLKLFTSSEFLRATGKAPVEQAEAVPGIGLET